MAEDSKLKSLFRDKLRQRDKRFEDRLNSDTFLIFEVGEMSAVASFYHEADKLESMGGPSQKPEDVDYCKLIFIKMYTSCVGRMVSFDDNDVPTLADGIDPKTLGDIQKVRIAIHFPTRGVLEGNLDFKLDKPYESFKNDKEFLLEYFKILGEIYTSILTEFYNREGEYPVYGKPRKEHEIHKWGQWVTVDTHEGHTEDNSTNQEEQK